MTNDDAILLIRQEADAHERLHANHSSRKLSDDYEAIGMLGEWEFAKATGIFPDLSERIDGDAGVDFIIPLTFTVDVKTARKAYHLIHEAGRSFADIYVLAEHDDQTGQTRLVGWEFGTILKRAPVRDFGYGIENHYIHRDNLRSMQELIERMAR